MTMLFATPVIQLTFDTMGYKSASLQEARGVVNQSNDSLGL